MILHILYVYIPVYVNIFHVPPPTPHACLQVGPSAARVPLEEKRDNNVVLKKAPPPQPEKEQVRVSECMTVAIGEDQNVVSIVLRLYANVKDPVVFVRNVY